MGKIMPRTKRWGTVIAVAVLAAIGAAGVFWPSWWAVRPACASAVTPEVEQALLREDWRAVLGRLAAVDHTQRSALPRLIKAHACLALNQNPESLCLFAHLSARDVEEWRAVTRYWALVYRDRPVAHYLYGDALARSGDWTGALRAYDRGLRRQPDHTLTLNARGTVLAAHGEFDQAVLDLTRAASMTPVLGDAAASLGATYLAKGSGARGAFDAFTRALDNDPDNVLARAGRACAACALGQLGVAAQDLKAATKPPPCVRSQMLPTIASLQRALAAAERRQSARLARGDLGANAWTAFEKFKADPWSHATRTQLFDTMTKFRQADPSRFRETMQQMAPLIKSDGRLKAAFSSSLAFQLERNRSGGVLDKLYSAFTGVSGQVRLPGGGKIGFDGKGFFDSMGRSREQKFQAMKEMNQISGGLGSRHLGGVDTNPDNAWVDAGQWGFVPGFGLHYPVQPAAAGERSAS
jgi:tetratricopeptide (TPR) repeat protein